MTNHWHVNRHSDDDDPYLSEDLFGALDYARTTLDELADFEQSNVSATAANVEEARTMGGKYPSVYEMEEALLSFAKAERYNSLMMNAANMVKQHAAKHAERAPLYQVDFSRDATAGWVYADAAKEADARLHQSALHTARAINEGSPLGIWDCAAELRTWPDTDQTHGGESYCADEYPDGYAGYQDGPCGDH